ncbi:MAG: transposase [Planctomycetota bacterium]
MTRSRSPKAVLCEAYSTALFALPAYSHRCSPKKFTQHQLFACLVLKDFYNLSYRATAAMLVDCSDLREAVRLERVPHFSTLEKAAKRLLVSASFNRLLATTIERAKAYRLIKPRPKLAAIDTSGFESKHCSRYFAKRQKTSGKHGR